MFYKLLIKSSHVAKSNIIGVGMYTVFLQEGKSLGTIALYPYSFIATNPDQSRVGEYPCLKKW